MVKTVMGLCLALTMGCGSRKKEDLAGEVAPTALQAPQVGVKSGEAPKSATCGPLDLEPQLVLNPTRNTKTAHFQGRFPSHCTGGPLALSLYIQATGDVTTEPGYGCNTFGGRPPFTIRCRGPLVALDPTGLLVVTLGGTGTWDPLSVKLQATFEPR